MKKARLGAFGAALLVSAAMVASTSITFAQSPAAPEGPGAPEKTTLKIVQGSDPDFTQVALTKAIETLNAQGITTEFASVVDTDTATRSVIAGQQDIVVNSLYFGINANQQGIPLRTFLADIQAVDYLLVSIPSVTDIMTLQGGTVGINKPGDLGATVADQCLKFANVDVTQVDYVQVGGTSARMSALLAGQIMAAPAHAAEALNAQKQGALNILADCGEIIGTFLQTGASTTQEWLDANPNLAQHFTDAYIDALRWAATDKEAYIELSKVVVPDLDDEIRDTTYDLLISQNVFAVDGGLTPESIQKLVDIGLDAAAITEPVSTEWYTMANVDSYLARRGAFGQ
ncbi:MAG: ABC transporter substrate-binding protein [Chloroflexi bacterium]|nr:ABC transporter substrate-binding protein [Chloroflexota bacterium]